MNGIDKRELRYSHTFEDTYCTPSSRRCSLLAKYPHFVNRRTDIIKQSQPKGLIFIWPQKRTFYYEREYGWAIKILSQLLYWAQVIGMYPSGAGMPLKKPPWAIKNSLPKPENRDYIIEPNWNPIFNIQIK